MSYFFPKHFGYISMVSEETLWLEELLGFKIKRHGAKRGDPDSELALASFLACIMF